MTVDPIEMSRMEALIAVELDDQKNIQLARDYHKGNQTVYLTERASEFLAMHSKVKFRLNVCQVVTTAVQDELNVVGFDADETPADGKKKAQATWAWQVWQANRMDAVQIDLHEAVLRDREAFIIVDWDKDNKRPRFTFHERFISTEAGGNGTGMWIIYENDDVNQPAIVAVNQWPETIVQNGERRTRTRRTVYYPDRVEKFYYDSRWTHFVEGEDQQWPIPWVDKEGKPLGIPVIHFRNEGMSPEAWEVLPIQDGINKLAVDILATADVTGFGIFVALGFIPTTDGKPPADNGSNWQKIAPAQIIGTTKSVQEADFKAIPASDVGPLVKTLADFISIAAFLSATPISRFIMTGQVASAESQKESDKPLKRKARKRRVLIGNAWEDMMKVARRLNNAFGTDKLDEKVLLSAMWEYSESIDELKGKRDALSIPLEQLWMEAGYSPEKIEFMKQTQEYKLQSEKLLWEAVGAAIEAGATFETVLRRAGIDPKEFGLIGTERLAAIKLKQEDVIPPTGQ